MALLQQAIIAGLGIGAVYALIAYGVSLVWMMTRTLNFAHGDLLMAAVFVSLLAQEFGASGITSIAAGLLAGIGLGVLLERGVFFPLEKRSATNHPSWLLGTIVFAALLRGAQTALFESRAFPAPFSVAGNDVTRMGDALLPTTYLWVAALALLSAVGLDLLMGKTSFGRAVRATAHSRSSAELVGIDTGGIRMRAFALAAGSGALAALLIAPLTFVSVSLGWVFTLKGFTAAVIGGIGRARGALVGGLVLGLFEQLLVAAEFTVQGSVAGIFAAGYREALVLALLIVVLVLRPRGLLGAPAPRFESA